VNITKALGRTTKRTEKENLSEKINQFTKVIGLIIRGKVMVFLKNLMNKVMMWVITRVTSTKIKEKTPVNFFSLMKIKKNNNFLKIIMKIN